MKLSFKEVVNFFKNPQDRSQINDEVKIAPNIFARLCKARPFNPDDYITLNSDPRDRQHFLMGHDSLERLLKIDSHIKMLYFVGLTKEYIYEKLSRGYEYELLIFESTKEIDPILATWDGVNQLVQSAYPEIFHSVVKKHIPECKKYSVKEFEKTAKLSFFEARASGEEDPRYLTEERFEKIIESGKVSPWQTRLFLYLNCGVRELFTGKGYTVNTETKDRSGLEYFLPRTERKKIPKNHKWIKLNVSEKDVRL